MAHCMSARMTCKYEGQSGDVLAKLVKIVSEGKFRISGSDGDLGAAVAGTCRDG